MAQTSSKKTPLFICCGVSGSGKTTLAQYLADKHALLFIDADDFHSDINKKKMAEGIGLTDADRMPWITDICDFIKNQEKQCLGIVLAHSCLKKSYRDCFRELPNSVQFFLLTAEKAVLADRLNKRVNHFANENLLSSQLNDLELPHDEFDIQWISTSAPNHKVVVDKIVNRLICSANN